MQAARYAENGPAAEVMEVGDLPDPQPAPGEVRVRLHASAVNPSDAKARGGSRSIRGQKLIPNSDGAGFIDAVGAGVQRRVDKRVWVINGQWERAFGTSAQYVALPSALAVSLPDHVSFEQGACLGIFAMTAHRLLFADGSITGKTVLVTGGAGVAGHYAIQLAKWAGARVLTTVSSKAKVAHARAAGANVLINYCSEDVVACLEAGVGGVDRIVEVDFGKNLPVSAQILNADGVIACYASTSVLRPQYPYPELLWRNPVVRQVFVYTVPDAAKVSAHSDIARWLTSAKPLFAIVHRYALEQVVAAHETVECGEKIGHVILNTGLGNA